MGLRCKEPLKAKWEDIDWDMKTVSSGLKQKGRTVARADQRGHGAAQ
jgi:integrase